MKKKVLSVLLSVMLTAAMMGCGSTEKEAEVPAQSTETAEAEASGEDGAAEDKQEESSTEVKVLKDCKEDCRGTGI